MGNAPQNVTGPVDIEDHSNGSDVLPILQPFNTEVYVYIYCMKDLHYTKNESTAGADASVEALKLYDRSYLP